MGVLKNSEVLPNGLKSVKTPCTICNTPLHREYKTKKMSGSPLIQVYYCCLPSDSELLAEESGTENEGKKSEIKGEMGTT